MTLLITFSNHCCHFILGFSVVNVVKLVEIKNTESGHDED